MSTKVLIPLPSNDFDPTEAAIPWSFLKRQNVEITFSTPDGKPARGDDRMLTGKGLFIWKIFLQADALGKEAYLQMSQSSEFQNPILWQNIRAEDYDGIVLAGGHAPGMRPYLESTVLQTVVAAFDQQKKIIGAICHGVVLAARSRNQQQQSILHNKKTTALLQSQEMTAWYLTRWWLGNYYRTYSFSVEKEVKNSLMDAKNFIAGPLPLLRDNPQNLSRGFSVRDGHYISARWPGDAHIFSRSFFAALQESKRGSP